MLVSISTLAAIDVLLNVAGFFVSGNRMARFESHPAIEMQVSVDDGMATVRILNRSEDEYGFGERFTLYRRFGWRWRRVFFQNEFTQGVFWTLIAYMLPPNSYRDHPIYLHCRFGELPSGEYRIVKKFWIGSPRDDSIRVAGGFTISQRTP